MILFGELVGASGFEPEASCAQGRRATRLRYAPTCVAVYSTAISGYIFVGDWFCVVGTLNTS